MSRDYEHLWLLPTTLLIGESQDCAKWLERQRSPG